MSNCVVTKIGNPTGPSPTLPPQCNTSVGGVGLGNFAFPLDINVVTAISTEMAAYPGGYDFGGHREHAGLDIGAPIAAHTNVYAAASGTVTGARDSCYIVSQGATCRLDITDDGDDFITSYTHVDVLPEIRIGSKVQKGQKIAHVHYWVEYSSMDHLHFELLSKSKQDSLGVGININPRNYFPELQRFPTCYKIVNDECVGNGQDTRAYTDSVGYNWAADGKEFAETYLNHPPCGGDCWAH